MNIITELKKFESWDDLTDVQKAGIESAIFQLDKNKGISHETVMEELKKKYRIK